MKEATPTYEEALQRLETIVGRFEQGNIDLDSLGTQLKEAQALLAFCKERLLKAESEVKQLLYPDTDTHEQE